MNRSRDSNSLDEDLKRLKKTVKKLKDFFFAKIEIWPIVLNFKDTYAAQDNCEQIILTIQNKINLLQKKKIDLKNAQDKVRQQL